MTNNSFNSFPGTSSGTVVQAGSIGALHQHIHAGDDAPLARTPHQLPPPAHVFVNQSATLDALDAALERGTRRFVLTGMGGVGKSCLAVHFLNRHLDRFPDGQLYAHLQGDTDAMEVGPEDVAAGFLWALNIAPSRIPESPTERFALLRTALHGRRCVLLLDSARAASQIIPLLPASSDVVVVVTSTRRLAGVLMHGAEYVELQPWPPECSKTLLGKLIGPERLDSEADLAAELLNLCAGLPLAVGVAAARIASRQRRPLARLVRELRQGERGLAALSVGEDSVARVFDLAYAELSAAAAGLYRAMGRLPLPAVTTAVTAVVLGARLNVAEQVLDELANAHLVEELELDRFRQHDLIRLHAAAIPEEDPMVEEAQLAAIAQYFIAALLQAEAKLTPSHHGRLPIPDADALDEQIRPGPFADEARALAWCVLHADDTAKLIRACAAHGMDRQAVELVHLKWPIYLRLGVPRIEELDLALAAARRLGDDEAIAMIQTGRGVLVSEGRYDEAIEALREAEAIYISRGDARGRAQALNSIAKIFRITDRLDEAWDTHETALGLRRHIGYTRGVGLTTHDMGRVAFERREYQRALTLFEDAVRILTQDLPAEGEAPDLYDGGLAQIWAARCMGELGQSTAALEQLKQAEQGMVERGSIQGRGTAVEAAGHVYEAAGDEDLAIASYRRARDLFESTDSAGVRRVRDRLAELRA